MTRITAPLILLAFFLASPAEARTCARVTPPGTFATGPCPPKARAVEQSRRPFQGHRHRVHRVSYHHHINRLGGTVRLPQAVSSDRLVNEASRYMGGNPTGWARVWCGKFAELVVRAVGGKIPPNPAVARSWASLPRTSPRIGAIAVMPHHVGFVSGFDGRGNPIIVSGNHGHRVGVGVYSRSRIIAYVSAS